MEGITSILREFIVSHLRSQVKIIQTVLSSIENSREMEFYYVNESLGRVVLNLQRLRKLLKTNQIKGGRYYEKVLNDC